MIIERADYALYKKLLRERVINTKAEMDEAERVFKAKRAAHNSTLVEEKAFHEGMDDVMSKCE